ncbi:hypothetical protein AVEN_181053-1 [Araneus ventricosus]|uniref:Uncharacterized protein n=1 Tax=Araneus ventricosus TaxID=182803 RepID=A0A4Y2KNL0_ARAVE|nr:hypothetical protein AVEN_181053-1 [Araneus ventricosus]
MIILVSRNNLASGLFDVTLQVDVASKSKGILNTECAVLPSSHNVAAFPVDATDLGRYLTAEEILELMNQADSDLSSLSDDDEDYQDNVELNDDDDDEAEDDDDISILDLISNSNPGKWGIHTDAFPAPTSNFCQKSGVNYSSSKPIEYFLEYLDDDFLERLLIAQI